jgi:rhodanese-related sulfurtransferase
MSRLALLLALSLAACSKSEPPPPPPAPTTAKPAKDPEAAKKMIAAGAVVVDVRTPQEFGEGHLPQATNIPIQDFAQRIAEVDKLTGGDKTKPVVVHCATGNRSGKAKQQLEAAGYTQVVNGGGLDDLQ